MHFEALTTVSLDMGRLRKVFRWEYAVNGLGKLEMHEVSISDALRDRLRGRMTVAIATLRRTDHNFVFLSYMEICFALLWVI